MATHIGVLSRIEYLQDQERKGRTVDWKRVGIAVLRYLTVRPASIDRLLETRDSYYTSPYRIPIPWE